MSAQRGQQSVGVDGLVALPGVVGVQRHLLDDAQLVAVLEAEPQQRHRVVEPGDSGSSTAFTLTGVSPRGGCGGEPGEHVGRAGRGG